MITMVNPLCWLWVFFWRACASRPVNSDERWNGAMSREMVICMFWRSIWQAAPAYRKMHCFLSWPRARWTVGVIAQRLWHPIKKPHWRALSTTNWKFAGLNPWVIVGVLRAWVPWQRISAWVFGKPLPCISA